MQVVDGFLYPSVAANDQDAQLLLVGSEGHDVNGQQQRVGARLLGLVRAIASCILLIGQEILGKLTAQRGCAINCLKHRGAPRFSGKREPQKTSHPVSIGKQGGYRECYHSELAAILSFQCGVSRSVLVATALNGARFLEQIGLCDCGVV